MLKTPADKIRVSLAQSYEMTHSQPPFGVWADENLSIDGAYSHANVVLDIYPHIYGLLSVQLVHLTDFYLTGEY